MQPDQPEPRPETATSPERASEESPQIWIGSLSDYNNGVLHGRWLDAARETEEIDADIVDLLARSPTANRTGQPAEEWAIFDSDGFGRYRVEEYADLATVARVARGIRDHGPAFAAWAEQSGTDEETLDRFEDAFLGHHASIELWVSALVDDLGYDELLDQAIPANLRPYVQIDVEQLARDMELSGDVSAVDDGHGGVWLFDGHL